MMTTGDCSPFKHGKWILIGICLLFHLFSIEDAKVAPFLSRKITVDFQLLKLQRIAGQKILEQSHSVGS